MDKLRMAMDFCIRHQTVLGYSIVSLLTAAMEQIFSSAVFKCPCNSWNTLYGSAFLIVPAFILFLLGYMVNTKIWRLLTGSCPTEKLCSCSCSPSGTCISYCRVMLPVTVRALVAPLTWIAVALLTATFYECAASGSSLIKNLTCKDKGEGCYKLLDRIPCDKTLLEKEKLSVEFPSLQAQSQLIGWFLLAFIATVALILTCVNHCYSPVSYLQLKFWKIYTEKEHELFETKAKEHAAMLAEINTKCFFEATSPTPFHTPSNEDWRKISFLHAFSSQEQYYSMIHKYVNTDRGNSVRFGRGDQNLAVLGCVDEADTVEAGF